MARPKRIVSDKPDTLVPTTTPDTVSKKEPYTLHAQFYAKDEEGAKIVVAFDSSGDTVDEVLANLDFPKGTNCGVKVTVTHRDKKVDSLLLSPEKARRILHGKDAYEFVKYFGRI